MSSPYWTHQEDYLQTQLVADRTVFTTSYAVIPKGVLADIVTSQLPFWDNLRIMGPCPTVSGLPRVFRHLMQVEPNGGGDRPEINKAAQSVIFVTSGKPTLTINDQQHT